MHDQILQRLKVSVNYNIYFLFYSFTSNTFLNINEYKKFLILVIFILSQQMLLKRSDSCGF